jgi:hypothetical protein
MEELKIRGEYWISNGQLQYADGDIGDYNHEYFAIQHIFSEYQSEIENLAENHNIEIDNFYGEVNHENLSELLHQIHDVLIEKESISEKEAWELIRKELGCNEKALAILLGGGDARLYVMEYENWIAVRSNNVELFGYDLKKQKEIVDGIYDILGEEGEENGSKIIELSFYDHKTKRSWNSTLSDLENPSVVSRPQQMPQTTYNKPLVIPTKDTTENGDFSKNKSQVNPWKEKGFDWRGTSETVSFYRMLQILKENKSLQKQKNII